jgi:hypothetical protein
VTFLVRSVEDLCLAFQKFLLCTAGDQSLLFSHILRALHDTESDNVVKFPFENVNIQTGAVGAEWLLGRLQLTNVLSYCRFLVLEIFAQLMSYLRNVNL